LLLRTAMLFLPLYYQYWYQYWAIWSWVPVLTRP
jgi:hypothetical protein